MLPFASAWSAARAVFIASSASRRAIRAAPSRGSGMRAAAALVATRSGETSFAMIFPLSISDPAQCLLDMRDRRLRQDAVTKIEDERALAEIFQNFIDRAVQCRAP